MRKKPATTRYGKIILLLVVLIGLFAGWFLSRSADSPSNIRNVLLISIDTCRADHFGCYGYQLNTTPNIDALAAEGVLFENVISPIPQTLPAHSSMMTGTIPPYHGVHENVGGFLADESNITLAKILKDAGFATGAAISTFVLDHQFGIDQGFDTYDDQFQTPVEGHHGQERQGGETTRVALDWLQANKDQRFFYFLHYYDPHTKYEPPEPFASQFGPDSYDGEIAYTDHCIGQVLARLKELDLYDSTLIIITADHGEMLGEHGELTHTYFIYQGAIKVPLIFKLPEHNQPARIKSIAGIIDIVPTVCSLLNSDTPEHIQGVDLSASIQGEDTSEQERYLYCESLTATNYQANSLLGIVNNRFKYIQTTRPELYDLVQDPAESNNLVEPERQQALIMQEELAQMLERSVRQEAADGQAPADAQTIERLQTLGYLGGSATEDFLFDQTKDDPKDLLEYHSLAEQMVHSFSYEEFDQVETIAEQMIQRRPDLATPYEKLGLMALRQKDYSQAIVYFQRVIEIHPDHGWADDKRGLAHLAQGDYDQAIDLFDKLIGDLEQDQDHELNPRTAVGPYMNRGMAYLRKGDYDRAVQDFDQVIRLDPLHATAYNNRGTAYVHQGDPDRAIRDFDQAIELDPRYAEAHHSRGAIYVRQGDFDRAIRDFNRSIELSPDDINGYNSRGIVYSKKGDYDRAIRDFGRIIKLDPTVVSAYNSRGMAYFKTGEPDKAMADFSVAIGLNPEYAEAYLNRGVTHLKTGMYDKAIADFTAVISLNPNGPKGYHHRGVAYAEQGEQAQAEADFARARQLGP